MTDFLFEDCGYWVNNTYVELWHEVDNKVEHTCSSLEEAMIHAMIVSGKISLDENGEIPQYLFELDDNDLYSMCKNHGIDVRIDISGEWNNG